MAYSNATPENASYLAKQTGLDPKVALAWLKLEGQDTPNPTNPLNIRYYGTHGQTGKLGGFGTYADAKAGLDHAAWLINNSGYYGGVRAAIATNNPAAEARAIELSPWAAGHYRGATEPGSISKILAQITGGTVLPDKPGAKGSATSPTGASLSSGSSGESIIPDIPGAIGGFTDALIKITLSVAGLAVIFVGIWLYSKGSRPAPLEAPIG